MESQSTLTSLDILYGVSVLDLDARGRPVEVMADIRGESCSDNSTWRIHRIGFSASAAAAAVSIYGLDDMPEEDRVELLRSLDPEASIFVQPLQAQLAISPMNIAAHDADSRGRGEFPWSELEDPRWNVAMEVRSTVPGIRELRLRAELLATVAVGSRRAFRPYEAFEEVLSAGRRMRARAHDQQ